MINYYTFFCTLIQKNVQRRIYDIDNYTKYCILRST